MQFFVGGPFHTAFRFGKLIDQFQQPIGLDQLRLGGERFL